MIILCESIQINFIQIYFKKVMTQRPWFIQYSVSASFVKNSSKFRLKKVFFSHEEDINYEYEDMFKIFRNAAEKVTCMSNNFCYLTFFIFGWGSIYIGYQNLTV